MQKPAMPTLTLDNIRKQYDPVWKALKPDAIDSYEEIKDRFQYTIKHFSDLLEILPPPRNILELACGTGIAAVELARLGHNVTGIDCSSEALEIAKTLEQHVNVKIQWLHDDMRCFQIDDPMDYILLWDVVFGIFASTREDSQVLERISQSLKMGGRCLFQFYNKSFAIQHGIENRYFYNQTQDLFLLDHSNNELPINKIKLYSHEEWRHMLQQVHMKIVRKDSSRLPDDPQDGPAHQLSGSRKSHVNTNDDQAHGDYLIRHHQHRGNL